MKKSWLKYVVATVLTVGALFLAFRGQDFGALLQVASHASIPALLGIVVFQLIAHYVRAWRWQYLLRPLKGKVSSYNSFKAVVAGYGLNNVIPRAGELVRPAMIARSERVPFAGALATIVIERILDVIALGSILTLTLFVYRSEFEREFPDLASATMPLIAIVAVALVVFVVVVVNRRVGDFVLRLIDRLLPAKIAGVLSRAFKTFTTGLHGLSKETIFPIIVGTVGVWLFYLISTFSGIFVFPGSGIESIGITGALALLALTGVSITIPAPGGTGTYHYFISRGLAGFFNTPMPVAIAFATITHAVNYLAITLLGLFYMVRAGVSLRAPQTD
ncbi:MAG: flippase-like domain-containing protein [Bacteroidetes bacterium]|nr:flippase-like domain-containing protein [Bacteroidota bacterium]